jgi:hypothetical protein
MKTELFQKSRATVNRIVYFDVPKSFTYLYVIALSLVYIIIIVHMPMTLNPGAPHDDGLFMSLGRSLAEGEWLGRYSQFTLMKGPGYPAFLAVANWLGVSASLAQSLFYCAAVVFFVAVAHRFIKSHLISGLLLALLLWHPLPMILLRILREQITGSLVLILFAAATAALFLARERKQRLLFAALAGFFLGWFWLTREEGIWILPAALLLVGAAAFHAFRVRQIRQLAATLLTMIAVFASIQVGFRAINWAVYGKFVGVDFKEKNFQRALNAIQSVRSGGTKPFVSIIHVAMKRVDSVSPAFASLASYFDGPGKGWETWGCKFHASACGEFGSGWFIWALRDAVAAAGHYASPAEASAFFGRIADEISAACARGALECSPQFVAEMPPVIWAEVLKDLPRLYAQAFNDLLLLRPPLQFYPSSGSEAELGVALRFLDYPLHTRSANIAATNTYRLSGWYYKSGHKWLTATVKTPDGSLADIRFARNSSPDIQAGLKDPEASHQRFILETRCNDECTLEFQSQDDEIAQKKLGDFGHGIVSLAMGQGHVHVDGATVQADPVDTTQGMDMVSARIRQAMLNNYAYVLVPVLILGVVCFMATSLLYWRGVLMNVNYIMALCSWALIVVRTSIVVLVDATSFPAINPAYVWPAQLFLVAGAFFSCATWFQLSGRQNAPLCPLPESSATD